ncbi:MAG: hypothetical protein AAGA87_10030 [Pseudomonadota bacterium]
MRSPHVFVLCTGRCGSTTFARACSHFTNYTAGHETRTARLGADRFDYPRHHIEADNRLTWLLGRLDRHFGEAPLYVHLRRTPGRTIDSFARRSTGGIMRAYRGDGILMGLEETDMSRVAADYVDTVTTNVELFLARKPHVMDMRLEHMQQDFPDFCDRISAQGDLDAALAEFSIRHNATPKRTPRRSLRARLRRVLPRQEPAAEAWGR